MEKWRATLSGWKRLASCTVYPLTSLIMPFLTYRVELQDADEFILIGCDGIWDCLTNEKAVEYVRARIDEYTPTEIGKMMLNSIISTDPRTTQGIGGDNMTILIIDLQPSKRRYRSREMANYAVATTTDLPSPDAPG
jgi:serine/threonine protein phosphatase PrpC